eukprot:279425-Chlamydomonas_euryale.AAC.1
MPCCECVDHAPLPHMLRQEQGRRRGGGWKPGAHLPVVAHVNDRGLQVLQLAADKLDAVALHKRRLGPARP